jgi:hypothetical protein
MKNLILKTILIFFTISFCSFTAFALELQLNYDVIVKEINFSNKNKEVLNIKVNKVENTIYLGKSYFSIKDNKQNTIYDFKEKRVFYLDNKKKTYKDISLFSIISKMKQEFQNKKQALTLLELEMLYGLEEKTNKTNNYFREVINKNTYKYYFDKDFLWQEEPVVECSFSDFKIRKADIGMFEKYLLYCLNLHPQIRKQIINKKKIPNQIKYKFEDTNKSFIVILKLKKPAQYNKISKYKIPDDFKKAMNLNNEIDNLILKKQKIIANKKQDVINFIKKAYKQQKYLDVELGVLEYYLQTEDLLVKELSKFEFKKNKSLEYFQYAMNMKDKKTVENSLQALDLIKKQELKKGYMLDVLKANAYMFLGEYNKAKELLLNLLQKNPYLTSIYKNLSDVYFNLQEYTKAWKCLDIAKSVNKEHVLLFSVNRYENQLAKEYL